MRMELAASTRRVQWHRLNLYINGTLVATTKDSATPVTNTTPVRIGDVGSSDYFNGTIRDARVYNAALTSSEVSELYYSAIPQIEHDAINGQTITTTYYEQLLRMVDSGSNYTSLGQVLTASITGEYWVNVATLS